MTCSSWMIFSGYSSNKTDCHEITGILLKVALNIITLTHHIWPYFWSFIFLTILTFWMVLLHSEGILQYNPSFRWIHNPSYFVYSYWGRALPVSILRPIYTWIIPIECKQYNITKHYIFPHYRCITTADALANFTYKSFSL